MLKPAIAALALCGATLMSGCTGLPAQNLNLHPDIPASAQIPPDTRVKVSIVDTRDSALVGQRRDRMKNTAPLSLVDAESALSHAVEHALEAMGTQHLTEGEYALTVYVDELVYDAKWKAMLQEVNAHSTMRVRVDKGNEHYIGKYSTEMTRSYVRTPTPADNDELMNALVAQTLGRAFADPKLVSFLRFK